VATSAHSPSLGIGIERVTAKTAITTFATMLSASPQTPWCWVLSCTLLSCSGGSGISAERGNQDSRKILAEDTAALCRDGQDNDDDGFADCADQDCWALTFCQGDGGPPADSFHDAPYREDGSTPGDGDPGVDSSLRPCAIHYDCVQGEFCYKSKCLRDKKQAVYYCGKSGCPPGHW